MPVSYSPWLVALSVVLAIQGSYVGLSFAVQVADASGARQRALLAGAAVCLALGVWTMHFVGMLAERVPFPVDYLVLPTLLSFLVCVIVVGAGVLAVSLGPATAPRIAAAAVFMGLGVGAMHYIGMETLRACAEMINATPIVLAAAALAIGASGLALWLAFGGGASRSLPFSAIALGLAISGMHYTAMSGLSLYPRTGIVYDPALSPDLLAVVVAIVAFLVSGGFLLLLLPQPVRQTGEPAVGAPARPLPGLTNQPEESGVSGVAAFSPSSATSEARRRPASHIPVQRNGLTHYLPVESIVAVRADAHYTHVFDGSASYFCSLPIGEVEHRLDPRSFARVHRSHIVNIGRVGSAKFNGDAGTVELATRDRHSVPVSRARIGQIKARLSGLERAAE